MPPVCRATGRWWTRWLWAEGIDVPISPAVIPCKDYFYATFRGGERLLTEAVMQRLRVAGLMLRHGFPFLRGQ